MGRRHRPNATISAWDMGEPTTPQSVSHGRRGRYFLIFSLQSQAFGRVIQVDNSYYQPRKKLHMERNSLHQENNHPRALKVEEMAQILSISRNSAYELVRSGRIRAIRVGRIYRIPESAMDEFLDGTAK